MYKNIAIAITALGIVISGCATSPSSSIVPSSRWNSQEAELEQEYESCLANEGHDCVEEERRLHHHYQWELLNRST